MTSFAVATEGLTRRYGPMTALDGVTLRIRTGEIYGLVGPNGSGKTTLVKTLCGLMKPSSGRAQVLGFELPDQAPEVRRRIGYMSQAFTLYPDLTVLENLRFFAGISGITGEARDRRIDEVVEQTRLGPYVMRPTMALSGGWKQRVALGAALIHRPPLMFLDEPTGGIDPVARREIWDLLFELAGAGVTIFVTTQYMDEVERCNEVGYLYLSKLLANGTPEALKKHELLHAPGTRRVEIQAANPFTLLSWMKKQPWCKSATAFGAALHAVVDAGARDALIVSITGAAGFRGVRVRGVEPSLEDVFVTLTEHAAKQAMGPKRG